MVFTASEGSMTIDQLSSTISTPVIMKHLWLKCPGSIKRFLEILSCFLFCTTTSRIWPLFLFSGMYTLLRFSALERMDSIIIFKMCIPERNMTPATLVSVVHSGASKIQNLIEKSGPLPSQVPRPSCEPSELGNLTSFNLILTYIISTPTIRSMPRKSYSWLLHLLFRVLLKHESETICENISLNT